METNHGTSRSFVCLIHDVMISMEWDKVIISIKLKEVLNGRSDEGMVHCSHTTTHFRNIIWFEVEYTVMRFL